MWVCGTLSAEVAELPPYDWRQNIVNAPAQNATSGYQVLHFSSTNYPYQEDPVGVQFFKGHLQKAKPLHSDAELIRYASDQVTLKGAFIELGVASGKSINFIAALNSMQTVYGFDSFEGNPEDWERDGGIVPKGTFGLKNLSQKPPVLGNVKLIQGLFAESLPYFVEKYLKGEPIAFLHVDSDLYSSANTAFDILGAYIQPGTIIVFDEFYNYAGYEKQEYRALMEFLERTGFQVEYIAFNAMFEGVAVRILSPLP